MELNGISAIVTGGASGLGEATARLLAERGAKVVVADMNAEKGEAVASDIGGVFRSTDVADTDQGIATVEAAKEMGPLRALVNAAGIGWATRTIGKDGEYSSAHDLDIFKKVLEVNLVGSFNMIRLAATAMSGLDPADEFGERGAIVNVASVAAFDGQIGQASYSASKGGVVGMTLPIARDLSAVGIRVNCIAPGLIETEMADVLSAARKKEIISATPVGRIGRPEEIAALVRFLLSDESSFMTGQTVVASGGRLMMS